MALFFTLFLIAFSLSLDAFAVAITCGVKIQQITWRPFLKMALFFGLFQGIMPLGGWSGGHLFKDVLADFSHWITASIFFILGMKTLLDLRKENVLETYACQCKNWGCLISLSIATSIDAFMIGLTFYFNHYPLFLSCLMVGIVTFCMTILGNLLGSYSLLFLQNKARLLAGILLIFLAGKSVL